MAEKASIRRACEAFNVSPKHTNAISNLFPSIEELDKCDDLPLIFTLPNEFAFFKKTVHQFHGKMQNFGTHASAVVVMTTDPYDFCAVERFSSANGEQRNLNYDYHDLEAMGLLKLDILGLETLDVIEDTLSLIGKPVDVDNLEDGDERAYELLSDGKTAGVFQLEGSTVRDVCSKVHPEDLSGLTAVVALGRPGAMQAGATNAYIQMKNLHGDGILAMPSKLMRNFERLFPDTYNCMIYQEQVMKLVQDCWGVSLAEADMVRRAIGRKDQSVMDKVINDLSSKQNTWGLSEHEVVNLLSAINKASGYLFNKSHSAAYAYTAYQTAYLKAHYPCQFYTALLNSNIDQEKALEYIKESTQMIGAFKPVSITESEQKWTTDGKSLRMGFSYIKGVGNAKFVKPSSDDESGLMEFMDKNPTLNKQVCVNLIKAGAFAIDPKWGLDYVEWFKTAYKRRTECEEKIRYYTENGKDKLREAWKQKLVQIPDAPDISSYHTSSDEVRGMQNEVLSMSTIPFWIDYDTSICNRQVRIVEVQSIRQITTRKGDEMWKIVGRDVSKAVKEYLFFKPNKDAHEVLKDTQKGSVVLVQISRGNSDDSVWCRDIVKAKKVA